MMTESSFHTAFWLLMACIFLMRVTFMLRVRRAGERNLPDRSAIEREGRAAFAFRVAAFFVMLGILVSYGLNLGWMRALSIPLPGWLRWVGFGLGLISVAYWTYVQVVLGTQWSAQLQLREEHHLVTSGPYGYIRHPLYTAMFGVGPSFALLTANWVFVGFSLVVMIWLLARVPREEQMMIEKFGDEYQQYMERTGRFLPRF